MDALTLLWVFYELINKGLIARPRMRAFFIAMPRRFTDTEKWRDEWWGSLSNDYRMIWLYLVDSCSIAGIWKKDFRGLNFNCNTKITEEEFLKVFGSRVIDRGNFFFIPKFLRYQCPKGLNSNKPAILSIIKELELNNLTKTINESLGNDFLIIKDKGKGKGTGKGEGKDKGEEKEKYITVENEKVTNPLILLQAYEPALNARQKEHSCKNWRIVLPEWFEQNLQMDFNDKKHVFNSFSKYLISARGKPPNQQPQKVVKFTMDDLNQKTA